ncbi:sigma-70 family RNA polymerase sigma factor [Actinoplanes sp. NPDC051513]|uniref:sigma-70 family RNA polymerase sigma factor n=1 Tax=Actinoplanes sp. NPDC051513 TaxID=3363908 RepID=UPI0037A21B65
MLAYRRTRQRAPLASLDPGHQLRSDPARGKRTQWGMNTVVVDGIGTAGWAESSSGLTRRITWRADSGPPMVQAVADFESVRSRLFGIAYQVVGRAADAEDVVQDAWIRWQTADRTGIRSPIGFLVTTTRRLALNAATSAYARREVCDGGWPPKSDRAADDPALEATSGDALEETVQLLMERLSPVECAVHVLHEAFDYPFRDIARALEVSEANARQLAHRARRHLLDERHDPVDPVARDRLVKAFRDATRAGDMDRLVELLAGRPHTSAHHRQTGRVAHRGVSPVSAAAGSPG